MGVAFRQFISSLFQKYLVVRLCFHLHIVRLKEFLILLHTKQL